VLAFAVARELNGDNFCRYLALLGRGATAEDDIQTIISALKPEGTTLEERFGPLESPAAGNGASASSEVGGLEVFNHPVVAQAASNVLRRTVILIDVLGANRTGGGMHKGVYAPWKSASPENEAPVLPPLCVAWENAARSRLIPLVPAALPDASCRVLPDQVGTASPASCLH